MKRSLSVMTVALALIAAASCNNSSNSSPEHRNSTRAKAPTPPLVTFCNNINYADTATLHNEQTMKATVSKIVRLLLAADSVTTRTGLSIFFNGLRHDETALSLATRFADHYLNNISSPIRSERKYIELLSALLDTDSLPDFERDLATERLRIVSLNRPGTPANDFRFEKPDGSRLSLHDIKAPITLLVFYNPECEPCSRILAAIAANPALNAATRNGYLAVVAVYAEGNREVWRNYLNKLPDNWTIGYDLSDVLNNEIYDLPAMPTLYLLDADKRVLLKDPDHRILGKFLRQIIPTRPPRRR